MPKLLAAERCDAIAGMYGDRREITGQDASGREHDRLATDEAQAELVRRIFQLYAAGHSLKQICALLNAEGVPSPCARERGKYNAGIWNPSTLSGDPALGEGILNNSLYIGRRIFNRRTWIEMPTATRGFRRQPRLNPEAEWIVRDEPDLRIITQPLWDAIKARQSVARAARDGRLTLTGRKLAGGREAGHLLSGLVRCGHCDQPFLASGGGRWRCKGARSDPCDNGWITTRELEERALAGIRDRLLAPEFISRFAAALKQELEEAALSANADRTRVEVELAETRDRILKLVARIEEDADAPPCAHRQAEDPLGRRNGAGAGARDGARAADRACARGGSACLNRLAAWISGSPLVDHAAARSGCAKYIWSGVRPPSAECGLTAL